MDAKFAALRETLIRKIPAERVIDDPLQRMALGTDASFYRLTPELVVMADNLDEICWIVRHCAEYGIHYTYRAAGTSLSGQALSDSLLITLTPRWRQHEIHEQGERVTLQPGVIGAEANRLLVPFGRKIGPDPASINTCKIGGIAANNASGMCCGTAHNSYQTLDGMTIVMWDGTVLDTRSTASVSAFKRSHAPFIHALMQLVMTCRADDELVSLIQHKYRLKNTTGYSLNALIDYLDPIDIIQHLMIGSEGTLGFIADITYRTVIDYPYKATGLFVFSSIEAACNTVSLLANTDVVAVELMDCRALASVANDPAMPNVIAKLEGEPAALLVEIQSAEEALLVTLSDSVQALIEQQTPSAQIAFSQDSTVAQQLWSIRKGLFPAVGAVRETGTTVIIEDVAFPIDRLAQAVRDLQMCFTQFGYDEAIIFGHALAGNLHFVFTQSFELESEVERYGKFMDAVSHLVAIEYQGSLKAEHGTGRNMAPYVELEWGEKGMALMRQIKALFDPKGLLNPGVIINSNKRAHLSDLKHMPAAHPLVDKCIECGFCEPVCPSRHYTLTPRQRNTVLRELKRMELAGDDAERLRVWQQRYQHLGVDTCAATGVCAERCPVDINTGEMMRQLRHSHGGAAERIATWSAEHFGAVENMSRVGVKVSTASQRLLGKRLTRGVSQLLLRMGGPLWPAEMPTLAPNVKTLSISKLSKHKVVYFPSCATRVMGPQSSAVDARSVMEVTVSLLGRAGFDVIIPDDVNRLCCGMPFHSKGYAEQAEKASLQLEQELFNASAKGQYPILMDTSPCSALSKNQFTASMSIYEPFAFIAEYVLPLLPITPKEATVMLHITCTSRRRGLAPIMEQVARACAKEVVIPDDILCCGFAGDKGFTQPELNAAALATLATQVPETCTEGYSNSRTCEIGLSHHSGIEYRSILYLVDEVSR